MKNKKNKQKEDTLTNPTIVAPPVDNVWTNVL